MSHPIKFLGKTLIMLRMKKGPGRASQSLSFKKNKHFFMSSSIINTRSFISITPGRGQWKTLLTIGEQGLKLVRNSVFDCHLSPARQKMTKERLFLTIFDLHSSIVLTFSIVLYPTCY